jgi:hypothetical protein
MFKFYVLRMKRSLSDIEIEDETKCALCTSLLDKPISLSCGHCVCKKCIPISNNRINSCVKCKICHVVNTYDLDIANISKSAQKLVSSKLNQTFSNIRQKFELVLNEYKSL